MYRNAALLVLVACTAGLAQQVPNPTEPKTSSGQCSEFTIPDGVRFPAVLVDNIDAKKLRRGDKVRLTASHTLRGPKGKVIIPKGAKLVGRITDIGSHSAADKSWSVGFKVESGEWKGGSARLNANAISAEFSSRPASLNLGGVEHAATRPEWGQDWEGLKRYRDLRFLSRDPEFGTKFGCGLGAVFIPSGTELVLEQMAGCK
jgi:hypothetical protein